MHVCREGQGRAGQAAQYRLDATVQVVQLCAGRARQFSVGQVQAVQLCTGTCVHVCREPRQLSAGLVQAVQLWAASPPPTLYGLSLSGDSQMAPPTDLPNLRPSESTCEGGGGKNLQSPPVRGGGGVKTSRVHL